MKPRESRVSAGPPASTRFLVLSQVGEGTYSSVFKAVDTSDGTLVALKRVKTFVGQFGVPMSFYRENECLRNEHLQSEHLVKLKDVIHDDTGLIMVLEYCEFDLSGLIHRKPGLSVNQVRSYAKQLLEGVKLMHQNSYIHRDLKPANVFVTRGNVVKLGDFGLSRTIDTSGRPMTRDVVTPVYRAPELLLQNGTYGQPVDVWSLGCLLYEMMTGKLLFRPNRFGDLAQLESIFGICGTPTAEDWPEFQLLPESQLLQMLRVRPSVLEGVLDSTLPPEFLGAKDLLMAMLQVNPAKRITVEDALAHSFFAEEVPELPPLSISETHAADTVRVPKPAISRPLLMQLKRVLPPPICA